MPDLDAVRRARRATATVFLVNGVVIGTWAAHIPLVEARLGISHATLGAALLFMAAGALSAMPLTGSAVARFGSATVLRAVTLALVVIFPLPLIAPHPVLLMAALFAFGAANGVMDVAMNAHGVMVERRLARAIMSSLHGMWSLGGLVGAGLAAVLLPLLPPLVQAFGVLAAIVVAAIATLGDLLPAGDDRSGQGTAFAWPSRATLGIGVLCFLSMASEGAVTDWSALHLKGGFAVGPGFAATGFAAFSAAMAAARFGGDRLHARVGAVALVRWSALVAAAGQAMALLAPWPILAVAGFALVGLGVANLVPVFFGAAGRIPGQGAASSIAAVATIGYSGFLLGPPIIGVIADLAGLGRALALIVFACLAIGIFAHVAGQSGKARDPVAPPGDASRS